jgi:hypothetical protein
MSGVDKTVLNLRDKTVLSFDPAKVQTLTINPLDKPEFSIKRTDEGKWKLVEGGKTSPADDAVVARFMDQIRDLKGNSIIMDPIKSPEMFGMDKPALVVTMLDKDGREVGQLRLAKIDVKPAPAAGTSEPPASSGAHSEYYAASSANTALFSTDDFLFSQMNKSAADFRAKETPAPAASASK